MVRACPTVEDLLDSFESDSVFYEGVVPSKTYSFLPEKEEAEKDRLISLMLQGRMDVTDLELAIDCLPADQARSILIQVAASNYAFFEEICSVLPAWTRFKQRVSVSSGWHS